MSDDFVRNKQSPSRHQVYDKIVFRFWNIVKKKSSIISLFGFPFTYIVYINTDLGNNDIWVTLNLKSEGTHKMVSTKKKPPHAFTF